MDNGLKNGKEVTIQLIEIKKSNHEHPGLWEWDTLLIDQDSRIEKGL